MELKHKIHKYKTDDLPFTEDDIKLILIEDFPNEERKLSIQYSNNKVEEYKFIRVF